MFSPSFFKILMRRYQVEFKDSEFLVALKAITLTMLVLTLGAFTFALAMFTPVGVLVLCHWIPLTNPDSVWLQKVCVVALGLSVITFVFLLCFGIIQSIRKKSWLREFLDVSRLMTSSPHTPMQKKFIPFIVFGLAGFLAYTFVVLLWGALLALISAPLWVFKKSLLLPQAIRDKNQAFLERHPEEAAKLLGEQLQNALPKSQDSTHVKPRL